MNLTYLRINIIIHSIIHKYFLKHTQSKSLNWSIYFLQSKKARYSENVYFMISLSAIYKLTAIDISCNQYYSIKQ